MGMETRGDRESGGRTPQERTGAPRDDFDRDLHPDHMAGQNLGGREGDREVGVRSAFDFKAVHRSLSDIPDDQLKQVPVISEGERLQQGATYLDLFQTRRGEFTAMGDMVAGPGNAYVAKDEVAYQTWNRLRGVRDPDRR
jgi:hypothetical protein